MCFRFRSRHLIEMLRPALKIGDVFLLFLYGLRFLMKNKFLAEIFTVDTA